MELHTKYTRAEVAQKLLRLHGEPYSLREYPMFARILNSDANRRVMRAGRQVSKTTIIAADMVVRVAATPHTPSIYCNSSAAQTASFSTSKLHPFLQQSPVVYHNFMRGASVIDNVYTKRLANNSEIIMSYFSESADRIRGKSGNNIYMDEVQDMLYDAMIDAEECLSAAPDPKFSYAGTSKSLITPLEFLWSKSTRNEWVIPCGHCKKHNRPSRENIGKRGLICKACGGTLNTYDGCWHPFNPPDEGTDSFAEGFWIPQIIMPMHCAYPEKWHRLMEKLDSYPEMKFDNEVMGLPCGDGESPITKDMLRAACIEELPMLSRICPENAAGAAFLTAGIDWGGGGISGTSRTVLSIYAVYPEQPEYRFVYGKIYTEGEPTRHIEDLARLLIDFGVRMVCGDHGGGNFALSQLASLIPASIRLVPIMYSDSSAPFRWDNLANRYVVNRTCVIDNFFIDLQQLAVRCFRWSEFAPFADDILNVRQLTIGEEHGKGRRVWRRRPDLPDDSLHSMVYGWFAGRILSSRLDFTPS